jgi:hypothetical protein
LRLKICWRAADEQGSAGGRFGCGSLKLLKLQPKDLAELRALLVVQTDRLDRALDGLADLFGGLLSYLVRGMSGL